PQFGLTTAQWDRLAGIVHPTESIHGIIHSGADVKWYKNYAALRTVNVKSAWQLLECVSSNPVVQKYIFISTAPHQDLDRVGVEESRWSGMLCDHNGYMQSKLIAESVLVQSAQIQQDLQKRVTIVKPGFIIGSVNSGLANMDDFLWRLVAGCVYLGSFPEDSKDSWVYISSYDTLAASVVVALSRTEKQSDVRDRVGSGMTTARFWAAVKSALPFPLVARPTTDWRTSLEEGKACLSRTHPLYTVLDFISIKGDILGCDGPTPHTSNEQSVERLERAVTRNVCFLLRMGYFSDDATSQTSSRALRRALPPREIVEHQ
ncbi:hypothetical protein LTR22_028322, partial [Elasticomyces elasticus]